MPECTCADPTAVSNAINQQSSNISSSVNAHGQTLDQTLYGQTLRAGTTGGNSRSTGTGQASHGAIGPLRFCNWAAPEYGPEGENLRTLAFKGAALAIAIANGIAQGQIADMQQDLANSYYDMAKYKWDRFSRKYVPLEKKLLNEVSSEPVRTLQCGSARNRADSSVNSAYNEAEIYLSQKAKQFHLCMDSSLMGSFSHRKALALADTANYNLADDQWYTDYKNDKRWNRRSSVLNLGRNLGSEATSYGDVARSLMGNVSSQIENAAKGLMSALGYYGSRNDIYYPTSYLGQTNAPLANIGTMAGNGAQSTLDASSALDASR